MAHSRQLTPTEQMLAGPRNPLIAISGVNMLNTSQVARSIGFIVEKLEGNLRLVVTVRHAFQKKGRRWLIAKQGPQQPTMLAQVGPVIDDTDPESDIAFLVIRDPMNADSRPFTLVPQDPCIKDGQRLYNSANKCNHLAGMFEIFTAIQPVKEFDTVAFCRLTEVHTEIIPKEDKERQRLMHGEGRKCYRMLNMISRPGNSGSPVWDDNFILYGMDVRGSTPENNPGRGDTLILIPTGELYAARQRIEPQLAQVLSSV